MRKIHYIIPIALLLLLLGCSNKFDELVEQADKHYADGDLTSAAQVYEKALEVEENADVRSKLSTTKSEIDDIRKVNASINRIKEIRNILPKTTSIEEFHSLAEELETIFASLESYDFPKLTTAGNYLSELKKDTIFSLLNINIGMLKMQSDPLLVARIGDGIYEQGQAVVKDIDRLFDSHPLPDQFQKIK